MSFDRELRDLINRHSRENESNTPDFILAAFLLAALKAFDQGVRSRSEWYGRWDAPGRGDPGERDSDWLEANAESRAQAQAERDRDDTFVPDAEAE